MFQFRELDNDDDKQEFFKRHGVGYTELVRLPYFDVVRMTVVDPMHNILLGVLEAHCRGLWGMDISLADGDGEKILRQPTKRQITQEQFHVAWNVLQHGWEKDLFKLPQYHLKALCEKAGVGIGGKHKALYEKLIQYVRAWLVHKIAC